MQNFRLVAFDLDDTLYPERDFVASGFGAVARHLSALGLIEAEVFFETAYALFAGGARGNIFNLALTRLGVAFPEERLAELVQVYREHHPEIRPFAESATLLQALKAEGRILALISDGPASTQMNKLKALGLEGAFHHLVFTGAYGPDWSKPSPRAFLEVMTRTQVAAGACVYVADNPRKDFVSPNHLGWHTIRVRHQIGLYYDEPPAPGGEPQETVASLAELGEQLLPPTYSSLHHGPKK